MEKLASDYVSRMKFDAIIENREDFEINLYFLKKYIPVFFKTRLVAVNAPSLYFFQTSPIKG